jgi:hypothetical protein
LIKGKTLTRLRNEIVEIISQFHSPVRFVSAKINDGDQKLRPAVAIQIACDKVPAGFCGGTFAVAGSLWSVSGLQSSERLVFLGEA